MSPKSLTRPVYQKARASSRSASLVSPTSMVAMMIERGGRRRRRRSRSLFAGVLVPFYVVLSTASFISRFLQCSANVVVESNSEQKGLRERRGMLELAEVSRRRPFHRIGIVHCVAADQSLGPFVIFKHDSAELNARAL